MTFLALAKASTESTSSTSLPAHMLLTRDLALDTLLDTLDTVWTRWTLRTGAGGHCGQFKLSVIMMLVGAAGAMAASARNCFKL